MKGPKMTPAQIARVLEGGQADTITIKVCYREPHVARVMGRGILASSTSSATIAADRAAAKYFGQEEFDLAQMGLGDCATQRPHWFTATGKGGGK
jgi:hypothetical protein